MPVSSGDDECLSCAVVPLDGIRDPSWLAWLTVVLRSKELVVLACRNRGFLSMYLCANGVVSTSSRFVCDRVRAAMTWAVKIVECLVAIPELPFRLNI